MFLTQRALQESLVVFWDDFAAGEKVFSAQGIAYVEQKLMMRNELNGMENTGLQPSLLS